MDRTPPPWIPPQLVGAPLDFSWEGPRAHAGPMQEITPLADRLSGTTTCGQLAMCAGILEWGAWRLRGHAPVEIGFQLAEAAFAYQVDPRYADHRAGGHRRPTEDDPPALGALRELCSYLWHAMSSAFSRSYYQPIFQTFHAANVVRHILPGPHQEAFDEWLGALSDRVHAVAAKPDEPFKKKKEFERPEDYDAFLARHWGRPLPREILDPLATVDQTNVAAFLARLDPADNPFLRSAEQMRALGFVGEPYRR